MMQLWRDDGSPRARSDTCRSTLTADRRKTEQAWQDRYSQSKLFALTCPALVAHGDARRAPVADMNNRAKLIAALGAPALAGIALAALALPIGIPAASPGFQAAPGHSHTVDIPYRGGEIEASEPTFYSEMAAVNARMHEGMEIAPSSDTDRDFIRMMIPHHQGATIWLSCS